MLGPDLGNHLQRYLELRRALGFEMRIEERLLHDFVTFVQGRTLDERLAPQAAVDWACLRGGPGWQTRRLSIVRGFLGHLRAYVPGIAVPESGIIPSSPRPTPFIYSDAQIVALMKEARSLKPEGSLRPHTYATLIGLLASCGLRPGEATRLHVSDVQLDAQPPRLVIRQTKFRKSRLVPVDLTTAEALHSYAAMRKRLGYDDLCAAFFVSESGTPLAYSTVGRTFLTIVRRLGISGVPHQHGPNLRCLRHSFAVRRVLDWYRRGIDVNTHLPHLSVYLGHAKPQHTYWYLTATPDLLVAVAERFESYANPGGEQ